jgi:glyceraldehyde-3-phosphate dehydrogenase (NAD(P))
MKNSVLVVGTGTIGEPLIGLLATMKDKLDIDEVLFYKRTPLIDEIAKVNSLCHKGAKLVATDYEAAVEFEKLGHEVHMNFAEAVATATVVIDCTPAGNHNKKRHYSQDGRHPGNTFFIGQGSEKGFGIPFAYGINDDVLDQDLNFLQVVSCNTHNIACLVKTIDGLGKYVTGDFMCMRRANDVSQDGGYIAAPTMSEHTDQVYGTHHARDVHDLFETMNKNVRIFSSAMKLNTQYMHIIRFRITCGGSHDYGDIIHALGSNKHIALTHKTSTNKVFSFGRDHGYYGRTYNQTVVSIPSLHVENDLGLTTVTGLCFTPQDGNSLLSSIVATLRGVHGHDYKQYCGVLDDLLFSTI